MFAYRLFVCGALSLTLGGMLVVVVQRLLSTRWHHKVFNLNEEGANFLAFVRSNDCFCNDPDHNAAWQQTKIIQNKKKGKAYSGVLSYLSSVSNHLEHL